ncbi:MAG: DUF2264 domain-containing protein [Motiliproteus sp.]
MINKQNIAFIARMQRQCCHRRWHLRSAFKQHDETLKNRFNDSSGTVCDRINHLTQYFWQAHQHYLHRSGTIAYYPGAGSIYGARNDGIEGVTRLLPLWAAYRSSPLADPQLTEEMDATITSALINGTDPQHSGYWGDVAHKSTLICEAGDIALALWLVKDSLWPRFNTHQQRQILSWLKQVIGKQTADSNWHLFVILVDKVIQALDPDHQFCSMDRYQRIKSFYQGNGCFTDGENGAVDLYNAWAFQYALYWLNKIDPSFDPCFITHAMVDFCAWYKYLFTDQGVVLFGRSLCYRMAAPAPLLMASELNPEQYPSGMALAALDSCWRFFISQGGVQLGRPSQGIFEDDLRWLDPYSGPASAFWATRSLVVFYHQSVTTDWQQLTPQPLPALQHTVDIRVAEAELDITTLPEQHRSIVTFYNHNRSETDTRLSTQTMRDKLRQLLYGVASRPSNNLLKQGVKVFDSTLSQYR